MRLVHGDQRYANPFEHARNRPGSEPFGGHIEQLERPGLKPFPHGIGFLWRVSRGQRPRPDAKLLQRADLIAHQGNQRRYHHRHPVAQKSRHLETKRFTTTRGHDGQRVFAGGNGLYDLLLAGAEPVKSKDITK